MPIVGVVILEATGLVILGMHIYFGSIELCEIFKFLLTVELPVIVAFVVSLYSFS